MKSYDALVLFRAQLERNINSDGFKTKVVLMPSSIRERGVHIQLAALKTVRNGKTPAAKTERTVRTRVTVAGTLESEKGLEMALDVIEALDAYTDRPLRLEDENGNPVPDTRIITQVSPEDSFLDSPGSTEIQDAEDVRTCLITIPAEE